MMKALNATYVSLLLTLVAPNGYAENCPWKVKEIGREIDKAEKRIAAARSIAVKKDEQIAEIRHNVLVGCQENNGRKQLNAFQAAVGGFDIDQEVARATTMIACMDEKREVVKQRFDMARASGNRTLERRLLEISRVIEGLAPRVIDLDISANQLASKITRLKAERDRLIETCDLAVF